MSVRQVLLERKAQFESFLKNALPKDKDELINEIKNKTLEEFYAFFLYFVIPNTNRIDEVIDKMLVTTGINRDDVSIANQKKFEEWLLFFVKIFSKCKEMQDKEEDRSLLSNHNI